MIKATRTLYMTQGDTFSLQLNFANSTVDLTGATVSGIVKDREGITVLEWTPTAIIDDIADLSKPSSDTLTYADGKHEYEIRLTYSNGNVQRIMNGTLFIDKSIMA